MILCNYLKILKNETLTAVFMSRNAAWPVLVTKRPPGSLMNPTILASLVLQIIGVAAAQGSFTFLQL